MRYGEFLKASEELLFSPEFKELEAKLAFPEPNIWQILGISRKETLISQFLAWLLDPQGQHSFGARFLKRLVVEALRSDGAKQFNLSPVEIAVMDLSTANVQAEYRLDKRRCDILVHSDRNSFLCVIENKVGAKESEGQTQYYYDHSFAGFDQEKFSKRVYIYLSPHGIPPESEHFVPLSYQAVLDGLMELQTSQQATETEHFLLRQFQENLQRSITMERKTRDLIQSIYDSYGSIIDVIYRNAERPDSGGKVREWDGRSCFFNIGEVGETPYSWDDSRQYAFICAGGARRYRSIMQNFKVGDIIYAYVSGSGYVGVGTVTRTAVPFRDAMLSDGTKLVKLDLTGTYNGSDDDDTCDWIVLVKWEQCVEKSQAVRLSPIVPSTASRVYEHRKSLIDQVRQGLSL